MKYSLLLLILIFSSCGFEEETAQRSTGDISFVEPSTSYTYLTEKEDVRIRCEALTLLQERKVIPAFSHSYEFTFEEDGRLIVTFGSEQITGFYENDGFLKFTYDYINGWTDGEAKTEVLAIIDGETWFGIFEYTIRAGNQFCRRRVRFRGSRQTENEE